MPKGRKYAAFRAERKEFLKNTGLTVAVVTLSILKAMTFHDLVVPAAITVVSLVVIWMEEEKLGHTLSNFLLTLAIILQIFLYQAHIGLELAVIVGGAGIAYLWYRDVLNALGPDAKALHVPKPIRNSVRDAKDVAKGAALEAVETITAATRPERRPSRISRGKSGRP